MRIKEFKVERADGKLLPDGKIYFGERIRICWELTLCQREQKKNATEELAVIYPYGFSVTEESGSIVFPVYEDMEIWMRTKDDLGEGIESQHYLLQIIDAKAEIDLCVTVSRPAYLDVEYTNASYGYLSQGVGRVEDGPVKIEGKGIYEFVTPYRYQNQVRYEKSDFYYDVKGEL